MLNKALDLLRTLGWGVVNFIYSLIDSLFDILKEINALDIVNSVSDESMFRTLYTGIMAIAITVLGLFAVWNFVKKIIDTEDEHSAQDIVKEIIKCGILVLMSTFMFAQSANLSIRMSGYTATAFTSNDMSLGDNMLVQYISFTPQYKVSDEFVNEDYTKAVANDNFTNKKMYNDKFTTNHRWILPDQEDYKYSINWIMAIIVGGFFLYALFFSGMMLARRQIEFLFMFVVSPIIFASSVGNKQRRGAVIETLVSLILQAAVIMLIIGLTAILMKSIQGTVFFKGAPVKDMVIKSILYIGCASFLLTGSQTINKFISGSFSAASGREQIMSLMHFGQGMKTAGGVAAVGAIGVGKIGAGTVSSAAGHLGGNKFVEGVGKTIQNFGKNVASSSPAGSGRNRVGNTISKFGNRMQTKTPSSFGKSLRTSGYRNVADALSTMDPTKNIYRRRYNGQRRL